MRSTQFFLGSLALLFLVCFDTACKKADPSIDPTAGSLKAVPGDLDENGWPIYRLPEEGFSLSLPPNWRQFQFKPGTFEEKFREILKTNPQLRDQIEDLREQVEEGMKFYAIEDSSQKTGFVANLSVLHEHSDEEETLDEAVEELLEELQETPVIVKPIQHERVQLANRDAEVFRYQTVLKTGRGKTLRVATTNFLIVAGNESYVLTFGSLSSKQTDHAPVFDQIAASLRLSKPSDQSH